MKRQQPLRQLGLLALAVGLINPAFGQAPDGPPRDVIVQGGPGGPGGFGPPGGFGMMGQVTKLVKQFDKDGDGKLSDAERQAMRAEFQAQRGQQGGPGGPPPSGPGAGGARPQGQGGRPSGGPGGPGGPGGGGPGGPGGGGPPAKPLTPEQVGVLRAGIDQGAR